MPAPIPIGMLRLEMVVWNPTSSKDSLGQRTESWSAGPTIWCHIEQAETREVIDDEGVSARTDFRILASWHSAVTVRSRIVWNDSGNTRTFNVRSCWDRDQRRRTLELIVTEIVP